MFFTKRKSRKQLLREIEELREEVVKQKTYKIEETLKLDIIEKQIKTISASCICNSRHCDDIEDKEIIENCLCEQLSKELLPYVSFEKYLYAPIDPHFNGEIKYIATVKIVDNKIKD